MLEFKFVLLLIAVTYPKITLKEVPSSEFQTAVKNFQDRDEKYNAHSSVITSNSSNSIISKLKAIKNICFSDTLSRFQEILLSLQNRTYPTHVGICKITKTPEKVECKSHCKYDRWFKVQCVSNLFN